MDENEDVRLPDDEGDSSTDVDASWIGSSEVKAGRPVVPPRPDSVEKLRAPPTAAPGTPRKPPMPGRQPVPPNPAAPRPPPVAIPGQIPGQRLSGPRLPLPPSPPPPSANRPLDPIRPGQMVKTRPKIDPGSTVGKWQRLKALCLEGLGQYQEAAELFEDLGDLKKSDENYDRCGLRRPSRGIAPPLRPLAPGRVPPPGTPVNRLSIRKEEQLFHPLGFSPDGDDVDSES